MLLRTSACRILRFISSPSVSTYPGSARTFMASSASWKLGDAKILERSALETSQSKWVGLEALDWQDESGKKRRWESASRKTRAKSAGVDAVAIFPIISTPGKPLSTVIVMQYRPPVDAICVELPAGLIDEGESPEEAAVRELYEETGYQDGKVQSASSTIVADPGMTSANMSLVTVRVEVPEGQREPKQKLDQGEHIVKKLVPIRDLFSFLQGEGEKTGIAVDARLYVDVNLLISELPHSYFLTENY